MDLDANRKFNWKEVYKCLSNPKGSALVLNIYSYPHHKLDEKERKGSEHDTSHMTELLNELGFQVTNVPKYPESLKEEITAEMFKGAIRNFAQSIDHYHADVCFMVIMAHGEQLKSSGNAISCSDGKSVPLTWIHSQFSSMECKYLIGKPKVFFYQICRGSHSQDPQVDQYNLDVTAERSSSTLDCTDHEDTAFESPKNLVRMLDDMLVCHAAPQGFEALRDREVGSVFIQTIIEVFVEMAHDTHVQRMMVEVDRRIKKKSNATFSQTTTYESIGFNKVLYLHPHLYRKTEEEPEEGACGVTENAGTSNGGDC
ncbi:caspase-2-like [Cloeon dipterum]|uniref:caspase-2-like n=1 Tax=Cloeon dipterum TaxID=197152 RepID=UPI0032202E2F